MDGAGKVARRVACAVSTRPALNGSIRYRARGVDEDHDGIAPAYSSDATERRGQVAAPLEFTVTSRSQARRRMPS